MTLRKATTACGFEPQRRRLALFTVHDAYECYAEGYVKQFWDAGNTRHKLEHHRKQHEDNVATVHARALRKVNIYKMPISTIPGNNLA